MLRFVKVEFMAVVILDRIRLYELIKYSLGVLLGSLINNSECHSIAALF